MRDSVWTRFRQEYSGRAVSLLGVVTVVTCTALVAGGTTPFLLNNEKSIGSKVIVAAFAIIGGFVLGLLVVAAWCAIWVLFKQRDQARDERDEALNTLIKIRAEIQYALSLAHLEPHITLESEDSRLVTVQMHLVIQNSSPSIISYNLAHVSLMLAGQSFDYGTFHTTGGIVRSAQTERFVCPAIPNVQWPPPIEGTLDLEMHYGLVGQEPLYRWKKRAKVELLRQLNGDHTVRSLNLTPEVWEPLT